MIGKILAVAATAAMVQASPAQAASGWICSTLDSNPTQSGVWELIVEAASRGYSTEADGRVLAETVQSQCPEYIPLLIAWAKANA